MIKKLVLGISSSLLLMASAAHADPLMAESENIVLYGDVNPNQAKETIEKMEIYRKLIMTLSGVKPTPDKQRLTIYAFDNDSQLRKFTGRRGIAGVYTQGYDGPIMMTPLADTNKQNSFNNQVALHEYSHHVLHEYLDTAFPRWYDEGFANYLSTFTMRDGTLQVGRAAAKHARGLMRGGPDWVDVEDVISSIRVYPFADKGSERGVLLNQFYAQGWLYVHYLHSDKELSNRLGPYLELVNSGVEPVKAFEQGFGISAQDFHDAAREYFENNKFEVQQFQPNDDFMEVAISRKRLTKAELDMKMALGQRSFLNKSTLNSYGKKLSSFESEAGQTAQSLSARATYYINKQEFDMALQSAQAALAMDPDGLEPLRVMGDVYFHKSHDLEFEDLEDTDPRTYTLNEDMKKSVEYFEAALRQNDEDYTSVSHMMSIYGAADTPVTSVARYAAIVYEDVYWDANDVGGTLNLSNIYMKSGKTKEACEYFDTAKKQAETDPNKDKSSLYNRVKLMEPNFTGKCASS
ncbi:hypothetical protein N9W89_09870 [Hellea sp.]|nr:hypothetical protein [Hellea sp.]